MRPSWVRSRCIPIYAAYRSLEVFERGSSRSYAKFILNWFSIGWDGVRVSCATATRRVLRLQPARAAADGLNLTQFSHHGNLSA